MEKNKIRKNAFLLWRLLSASLNRPLSYRELKTVTKLSDRELNMAIGWLARENNIDMETDSRTGEERFFLYATFYF